MIRVMPPPVPATAAAGLERKSVVVDDVCAWPNLTLLRDGTIAAAIYNQPVHGRWQGDVDVYVSADGGRHFAKRGVAAPGEPPGNRMDVAAGCAGNGDLIVISSGHSPCVARAAEPSCTHHYQPAFNLDQFSTRPMIL